MSNLSSSPLKTFSTSSKTSDSNPTQSWHIPNIINGKWDGKLIYVKVPNACCKCGKRRSKTISVSNKAYGSLIRALCLNGCTEEYEDVRLQAEVFKSSGGTPQLKPKFDPWVPDTRVGSLSASAPQGMTCANKYCNEFCGMAEANQPNGTFICYSCRNK